MKSEIKVADEVWVACALLHTENPAQNSFSNNEIADRVKKESIADDYRVGIWWHINLHCVANKKANPANYRMLYKLPDGSLRLFKSSDDYHFSREDGKILPNAWEIPEKYRYLLKWYTLTYNTSTGQATHTTPIQNPLVHLDPKVKVTVTEFSNEHQMIDFAYHVLNRSVADTANV